MRDTNNIRPTLVPSMRDPAARAMIGYAVFVTSPKTSMSQLIHIEGTRNAWPDHHALVSVVAHFLEVDAMTVKIVGGTMTMQVATYVIRHQSDTAARDVVLSVFPTC